MKVTDSLEKVYTAMGGEEAFDKSSVANGIEQISEVAGSGGGGGTGGDITIIPYIIFDATTPMGGGFIKSFEPGEENPYVFYTYAELFEILQYDSLRCFARNLLNPAGTGGLCTFIILRNSIAVHHAFIDAPSIGDSEPQGYMTDYYLKLNSDDTVEADMHSWMWPVTNDD